MERRALMMLREIVQSFMQQNTQNMLWEQLLYLLLELKSKMNGKSRKMFEFRFKMQNINIYLRFVQYFILKRNNQHIATEHFSFSECLRLSTQDNEEFIDLICSHKLLLYLLHNSPRKFSPLFMLKIKRKRKEKSILMTPHESIHSTCVNAARS